MLRQRNGRRHPGRNNYSMVGRNGVIVRLKCSSRKYVGVCALSLTVIATGCSTSSTRYDAALFSASKTRNASNQAVGLHGNQTQEPGSSSSDAMDSLGGDVTQTGGSQADATTAIISPNHSAPGSDIYGNETRSGELQRDNPRRINMDELTPPNNSLSRDMSIHEQNFGAISSKIDSSATEDINDQVQKEHTATTSAPDGLINSDIHNASPSLNKSLPSQPSDTDPSLIGFRWPVRGRIIEGFGKQSNGDNNNGIYLAAPEGTPILSASSGIVIYAGAYPGEFGNLVLVKHEDDWVSAYAHADVISVSRGDKVERGQHIATVGRTGNVSSPQLHFELRKNANPVDPLPIMTDG